MTESRQSDFNIESMLRYQRMVIRAIIYSPSAMANYVHYRGSNPVIFKTASIQIPPAPLIRYNNPSICCLLDNIGNDDSTGKVACNSLTVEALGPRGKIGIPYIVRDIYGNELIVKLSKIDVPYSTYRSKPPTSISDLDSRDVAQCITNIELDKIQYLASDEFTNETLISYLINYIGDLLKLPPLFVTHYEGAICSDKLTGEQFGLNIMEHCDLGPLDKVSENPKFSQYGLNYEVTYGGYRSSLYLINESVVKQILTQITVGIHMLQHHVGFISGDLKAGNIFLKSDPIDTKYMGIQIKCPFTCKIADYGKSSAMFRQLNGGIIRFYNDSKLSNLYMKIHPFSPNISQEDNEYYYTIGDIFTTQLYTRIRHMGIPFYRSFDYYTVLVSLLTIPAFYYTFFASDNLRKIFWDPIWNCKFRCGYNPVASRSWDENGGIKIMEKIHTYVLERKGRKISDAINILRGTRLKCQAVNIVIDNLRADSI